MVFGKFTIFQKMIAEDRRCGRMGTWEIGQVKN